MKNQEIIAKAAVNTGLLTAEEAERLLSYGKSRKMVDFTLQEHTYIRKSKCRKLNKIYSTERLK